MVQITNGIEHLHQNNIVHRDIKPGNILVTASPHDGRFVVKLTDFGLSKFLDPTDETSAMSSDVGTLMFKAPEYFDAYRGQGQGKRNYHRNVDIYAAGLTFLSMIEAKEGEPLRPATHPGMSIGMTFTYSSAFAQHNSL